MKRLLIILLILCSGILASAQAVVETSPQSMTSLLQRAIFGKNMTLPRYTDTTAANAQKGVDSCGALIFTYTGNKLWIRICPVTGKQWKEVVSNLSVGSGADSLSLNDGVICWYKDGISHCYALSQFYAHSTNNFDGTRIIHYNIFYDILDSVNIPHVIGQAGANMTLTRKAGVGGAPDTVVFAASAGGSGGTVGISKIQPGLYETLQNDSTTNVDSAHVAIKDTFFTPHVVPFANLSGILTKDIGGLEYIFPDLIVGHNDPDVLSGLILNGSRGKIQAWFYGLRFQVGITGNTDETKEYNFFNANNTIPYLRLYSTLNTWYTHHAIFNTDVQFNALSTDSTALPTTGTLRMVVVDKNGKFSWQAIPTVSGGTYTASAPITLTGTAFGVDTTSGTATALVTQYQRKKTSDSLMTLIALRLGIADTAAMLSPYKTSYPRQAISVTATGSGAVSYDPVTGVINVPTPAAGSAPDSSWNAIDVGYPPNAIGTLYETFLNTGSMMSGWSVASAPLITPTFTGSKMNVTGGNYWRSPAAAGQGWGSAIRFSTKRMPYEKLDFTTTVIIGSKSAGNIIYLTRSMNGLLYSASETAAWNLSNDFNSGKFGIGSDSLVTWATGSDSTSKAVFSIGDTVQLYLHKDGWSVTGGINNLTTHKRTAHTFSQVWNGSGGEFNIGFIKGTYGVTNIKFSTWEEIGKIWVLGDSHLSGSGTTKQSNRYIDQFFKGNTKYYGIWGLPSLSAKYADLSGFATEILADARPSMFINALGYNDKSEGFGAPAFKVYMDSINQKAIRALGATNVVMISIPPRGTAGDAYNDSLFTLATAEGITIVDITTGLKNGLTRAYPPFSAEGVHFNDLGHANIKNSLVAQIGGRFLSTMVNDSTKVFKLYGIPTARAYENSNILVRESDGTLAAIPNTLPTTESVIQNRLSLNTFNYASTANTVGQVAGIHVTSAIKTDSALEVLTSQGLRIGFSNPLDASNTYASNINIGGLYDASTNAQVFNNLTGAGIVDITAPSANKPRGSSVRTVSANNNTLINAVTGSTVSGAGNTVIGSYGATLTSGVNNFFAGIGGGKGISTKNSNIDIDIDGSGPSTDVYNTITFGNGARAFNNDVKQDGDVSFNTGVFNPKFWFGGRAPGYASVDMDAGAANGTNFDGATWNFNVSRSTGLKLPGAMIFNSYAPVTSGSTLQSTLIPKFRMSYGGFSMGSTTTTSNAADLLVDMQSTTQGFGPPRMTSAQRDAMVAGVQNVTGGGGTLYTNGVVALTFTGGTGTAATAYATIASGIVGTPVLVTRGSYTVAPTGATITSGPGTGATFTVTTGVTTGSMIYCTDCTATDASTGVNQSWNGTTWKNNW